MNNSNLNLSKNRLKIAETYLKLDISFNTKNDEIESIIKQVVDNLIGEIREKLKEDIVYEIVLDKGSTKVKVIFFAFLNGLIFYANLKDSIITVYNDVKTISEMVIEAAKENPLIEDNIIRTEKRTGVIGRLKRTLNKIEKLENDLDNLGNNQIRDELRELYQEIANLTELLEPFDRQMFINFLNDNLRNALPEPNQNEILHLQRLYAIKPEDEEE